MQGELNFDSNRYNLIGAGIAQWYSVGLLAG
jgi:hypothetical protein